MRNYEKNWFKEYEIDPYEEFQEDDSITNYTSIGIKKDKGKNRLDLINPNWIIGLGEVLTFGSTKGYGDRNWINVDRQKIIGSLLRHTFSYLSGDKIDKESGKSHLYHIMSNVCFLIDHDNKEDL